MPARLERLYICPSADGEPITVRRLPPWWSRTRLLQHFRERMIDTGNPIYVDYGILLTAGEVMAWNRQESALYIEAYPDRGAALITEMDGWANLLGSARWVIVESYEWESGLS